MLTETWITDRQLLCTVCHINRYCSLFHERKFERKQCCQVEVSHEWSRFSLSSCTCMCTCQIHHQPHNTALPHILRPHRTHILLFYFLSRKMAETETIRPLADMSALSFHHQGRRIAVGYRAGPLPQKDHRWHRLETEPHGGPTIDIETQEAEEASFSATASILRFRDVIIA